jgi:NADPH-dependent glutamate synthase beta subunit-like oxidoreductase
VALVAQEKFDEAYDLIRMDNPIPATLGRVCVHHCEDACKRGEIDKPIRICALKRFASDESVARLKRLAFQARRPGGKRVAVVGAGPAGLACANDLALKGYRPTIFEAHPVPGGMLHLGIPAYRLPRDILLAEVKAIQGLGVKLELNSPVTSIQALKDQGFEAVFLGVGAHKGLKLNVPGENDFEGFLDCTTFLREVNLGQRKEAPGDKLIVIGGGNASMDAVRSSIRLGAKEVNIVYRRTEAEMPANPAEIRAAKEEGIRFHFLASPVRIQGESGKVTGMTCIRNELGEPDSTGRRRPVPVDGSEFTIEADCIIPAISQEPDLDFLGDNASGFHTTRWNTFEVHPETLHTNVEGVFAGGDCVSGPSTVVEAVAAGQRAAVSIDCYLRNEEVYQGYKRPRPRRVVERVELTQEDESQQRAEMPERDPAERKTDFKEVELGLEEQAACNEARRCLRCDVAG